MTNPDNAVGTNAAYGGRTSVNAFNDDLSVYSRGIISGWSCEPSSGLTVVLGGDGTTRDVAVAEDDAGNKTTINNISGSPISVTIGAAPGANSRIDSIVAYVNGSPQGSSTIVDNYEACGLIVVEGSPSTSPLAPSDSAIRSAITADGASGATAYYVVLSNVSIASGTTDITATNISAGQNAVIQTKNLDLPNLVEVVGSLTSPVNYALKYEDGTMIAVIKQTATVSPTTQWGTLYQASYRGTNLTFASEFYSVPSVSISTESAQTLLVGFEGSATTLNPQSLTLARPQSASNISTTINVIAIGRWKA